LNLLRECGEAFRPAPHAGGSSVPGDDKFIASALAARASYLVTGNHVIFRETGSRR
jgi:predicted nucleic acid-binding protein